MKVSKAIELLELDLHIPDDIFDEDRENAQKLGIEALKRLGQERDAGYVDADEILPGETPENEK